MSDSHLERLKAQNKSLHRMQRLVSNLLDLSELELTETCSAENFILNELVESVVDDFQPLVQDQNINFLVRVDDNITVKANKDKIKRMLINLVDNALKYNQLDGEILLQIHADKKDMSIICNVHNTGPGVPAEDFERVFEQFYRVEKSRSPTLGGSGLGLTIVKRIVDLHGGEILLRSNPGKLTQVRVALPILVDNLSS